MTGNEQDSTSSSSSTTCCEPVVIPIQLGTSCGSSDSVDGHDGENNNISGIPEWAMIELNGELIAPKEFATGNTNNDNNGKENPLSSFNTKNNNDDDSTGECPNKGSSSTATSLVGPDRIELGSIRFVDKTPIMIMGSHELTGTVETLKQPYIIFRKKQSNTKNNNKAATTKNDDMKRKRNDDDGEGDVHDVVDHGSHDNHDSNTNHTSKEQVTYEVSGIVTRKLLFNKYPKLIMK